MDKILDIARHIYPLTYIIVFFIIFLCAVIYWTVFVVNRINNTCFAQKFLEYVSEKMDIIVGVNALIILMLLVFPFTGYVKCFKISVKDGNDNNIDNYKLYNNKKSYNSVESIWINNTELPTSIKVNYQALYDTKDIDIEYFIKNHAIEFNLDKKASNISFDKRKNGFKAGLGKKILFDNGGADLFTTSKSIDSYLILNRLALNNVNNFELLLNALVYDKNASLTIEIGEALRILFGEGNLKTLKIETNLSRRPDDWVKHSSHEIEFDVVPSKPFKISVISTANINSTTDLIMNIYYDRYASKSISIKSIPVTINRNSLIKLGCINRTKTKSARLIDLEINSSKPKK